MRRKTDTDTYDMVKRKIKIKQSYIGIPNTAIKQ